MSELSHHHAATKQPLLSDRVYTVLKHSAGVVLPALSALYFTLAQIWHFPDTAQVMGTIAAVNTAVGALVGVSTLTYNNSDARYAGAIEVTDTGDKKIYSLNLNADPATLDSLPEATFKVTPVTHTAPAPEQGNPSPSA